MKSKAAVRRIVEELKVLYPNARCSLELSKGLRAAFCRAPFRPMHRRAREHGHARRSFRNIPSLEAFANATL